MLNVHEQILLFAVNLTLATRVARKLLSKSTANVLQCTCNFVDIYKLYEKYELGISKTLQWEKHLLSWFIPHSV